MVLVRHSRVSSGGSAEHRFLGLLLVGVVDQQSPLATLPGFGIADVHEPVLREAGARMPDFSVINIRPSGRNVIAQGDSKSAITCVNGSPADCWAAPEVWRAASTAQPATSGTRTVYVTTNCITTSDVSSVTKTATLR